MRRLCRIIVLRTDHAARSLCVTRSYFYLCAAAGAMAYPRFDRAYFIGVRGPRRCPSYAAPYLRATCVYGYMNMWGPSPTVPTTWRPLATRQQFAFLSRFSPAVEKRSEMVQQESVRTTNGFRQE